MTPTLSKAGLGKRCLYWQRPEVLAPKREDSVYAIKGRALHALVETGDVVASTKGLDTEAVAEVLAWFDAWQESEFGLKEWVHERALAYDTATDTARFLGTKGRNYVGVAPTEWAGTPDLYRVEDGRVIVPDIKTGWQESTDPAAENLQLHGYALALCRIHDLDSATVIVAYVDAEGVRVDTADLDAIDLHRTAAELRRQFTERHTAEPKPGFHCTQRYCPAMEVCPATHQATALVMRGTKIQLPTIRIQGPEHAARAVQQVPIAEAMLDAWKRELRAYADRTGGVPLPDGRKWRGTLIEKTPIDLNGPGGSEGIAILGEYGLDDLIKARATLAKSDVERDLRKRGLRGKALRSEMSELMAKLESVGAVKRHEEVHYRAGRSADAGTAHD